MLYVGYVLEKLLDLNEIIDNVVTSDRYTHVRTQICFIPLPELEGTTCVSLYYVQRLCLEIHPAYVLYAQYLLWTL